MKKILPLLLLSFLAFPFFNTVNASHEQGVTLTYEYLNTCTIRVHFKAYRDCAGVSVVTNNVNFIPSTAGCVLPTPISSWSVQLTTEITPICPSVMTNCSGGSSIPGVQEYSWYRDYDMCTAGNCNFTLSWSSCCRNNSLTSVPNNLSMHIGVTVLNNSNVIQNSGPQFTRPPHVYLCAGSDYSVHQGAYDADGDSLSYVFGPCFDSDTTTIPYNSGYSVASPLGSSWNVSLDPVSGQLDFDANPGNLVVGLLCIYVNEWRNGVLINTYVRDWQVTVINCSANNNPVFSGITNLTGGTLSGTSTVNVCGNNQVCFDLPVTDADPGDIVTLVWDQHISGATFADAGNASIQDTIVGTNPTASFCFTPPGNGVYQFLASARDNKCPIYGSSDQFVTIIVGGGSGSSGSSSATANLTSCNTITYSASVCGGTGTYTYNWSGAGGLSSTAASFAHTYAGPGSYPWQVIISDGASYNDTLMDTVVIAGTSSGNLITPGGGGGAITLCPGQNVTLNAAAGYSSYIWSTGSTAASINVNSAAIYSLTATDANGCSYMDFVNVTVQAGTTYANIIGPTTTNTLKTCSPGLNNLNLYIWGMGQWTLPIWSTGDTATYINVDSAATYYVWAQNMNGCQFEDSIVIMEDTLPDLKGNIKTYNGFPLANQLVYLIRYDTVNNALWQADTTTTDANGDYEFCYLAPWWDYFVKAAPDSAAYPMNMPTYYDTTLFWNNAVLLPGANAPYIVNFNCLLGNNPGGPGFISGLITQGANKTAGVGDPMPNVRLILRDASTGYFVDEVVSDTNGYVAFGDLKYGTYQVYPDHPFITTKTDSIPVITLDASNPSFTGLSFLLHSSYLELDMSTASTPPSLEQAQLQVYPNPFEGTTLLDFSWKPDLQMKLKVYDVAGKVMESDLLMTDPSGALKISVGNELESGVYFVEMEGEGRSFVRKIVKF